MAKKWLGLRRPWGTGDDPNLDERIYSTEEVRELGLA
jgi:hypothetical protein